jgi:hypothetical protein
MTEDNIVKNQMQLVEERKQYVLAKSEQELGALIAQCNLDLKRKDDNVKKILLNLKGYVYQPCSDSTYDICRAVTNIAAYKCDVEEIEKRKLRYVAALSEIKGAFTEAEAK